MWSNEKASVNHTIEAMINLRTTSWSPSQTRDIRIYLLSPTGRFQLRLRAEGITTMDELTTGRVATFLNRVREAGLKATSVEKYRVHMRTLATFQAETTGYGSGLHDIDRIRQPRMPKRRLAPALTEPEEGRILAACTLKRDRLVLELLLATGIRRSELCALSVHDMLAARPPYIHVGGNVYDPDCTKGRSARDVNFRQTYRTLPARLADWIAKRRDPSGRNPNRELFLKTRGDDGVAQPLSMEGLAQLCQRVSERAGVHFSPRVLRHTWATRWVDAGLSPFHLMQLGGWSSVEIVHHYRSVRKEQVFAAAERLRA